MFYSSTACASCCGLIYLTLSNELFLFIFLFISFRCFSSINFFPFYLYYYCHFIHFVCERHVVWTEEHFNWKTNVKFSKIDSFGLTICFVLHRLFDSFVRLNTSDVDADAVSLFAFATLQVFSSSRFGCRFYLFQAILHRFHVMLILMISKFVLHSHRANGKVKRKKKETRIEKKRTGIPNPTHWTCITNET